MVQAGGGIVQGGGGVVKGGGFGLKGLVQEVDIHLIQYYSLGGWYTNSYLIHSQGPHRQWVESVEPPDTARGWETQHVRQTGQDQPDVCPPVLLLQCPGTAAKNIIQCAYHWGILQLMGLQRVGTLSCLPGGKGNCRQAHNFYLLFSFSFLQASQVE